MQQVTYEEAFLNKKHNWRVNNDIELGQTFLSKNGGLMLKGNGPEFYDFSFELPKFNTSKSFSYEIEFYFDENYNPNNNIRFCFGFGDLAENGKRFNCTFSDANEFMIELQENLSTSNIIQNWITTKGLRSKLRGNNRLKISKFDNKIDNNLYFEINGEIAFNCQSLSDNYSLIHFRIADGSVSIRSFKAKYLPVENTQQVKKNRNVSNQVNMSDKTANLKSEMIRGDSIEHINSNIQSVLTELNGLIGLDNVKQEIHKLINFIKVQKARENAGLKTTNVSYHIVFTGNPGTGKTTVARIIGQIYKALGVLRYGNMKETDRSGLVGEYIGHTEKKVNDVVDKAMHGVLFIDEAYSLIIKNTSNDFGKLAIDALVKRMEDDRDKIVVIVAGYTNEMKEFIEANPGLKSRFNRYIEFSDYTPDELFQIYKTMCEKQDYQIREDAVKKINLLFETVYQNRDKTFGNGRFVRNIFEKTVENLANRISSGSSFDRETLTTITIDDIIFQKSELAQ